MLSVFKIRRIQHGLIFLFGLTYALTGFSAGYESIDKIKSAAKSFILSNVQTEPGETLEMQINQANTPLQVAACDQSLEVSLPKNGNTEQITAVEIACQAPQAWHLYVPVEVQIYSKVLITKRTLPARSILSDEDIGETVYNKNLLYSGFFVNKEEVVGTETTHLIAAGTVLTRKNIQLPVLVHRNQAVTLVSQKSSIIVSMQGIAKTDGSLNSMIKVFNPTSKRTIDAIVTGPSKAQVAAG